MISCRGIGRKRLSNNKHVQRCNAYPRSALPRSRAGGLALPRRLSSSVALPLSQSYFVVRHQRGIHL
jgi:hypothetical protein